MQTTGSMTTVRPLDREELVVADRCARRLSTELSTLVGLFPQLDRSNPSRLSRYLGIERTTCHRLLAALSDHEAGPATLTKFPGIKALRLFLEKAAERVDDTAVLAGAESAVEQFEATIAKLAQSQQKLTQRLVATEAGFSSSGLTDEEGMNVARGERLFRAAADVCGSYSEAAVHVFVIRPDPEHPEKIQQLSVQGVVKYCARENAIPYLFGIGRANEPPEKAYKTFDESPASGQTQKALIEPFCSMPLPKITSRRAPDSSLIQVVDPVSLDPGDPVDVFVGQRYDEGGHPALETPPLLEVWTLQHYPAQNLLFDVYLHPELARANIPSLSVHMWRPNLAAGFSHRWFSQHEDTPKLALLGQGLKGAGSTIYPRQRELVSHVFDQVGWDPGRYVGYRCEVGYPLWRLGYCMSFDFSEDGPDLSE